MIYFDHASALRPDAAALELLRSNWAAFPANHEAAHAEGRAARRMLEQAAETLKKAFGMDEEVKVFFGNTGSELLHAVSVLIAEDRTVLTSPVEHPALLALPDNCGAKRVLSGVSDRGEIILGNPEKTGKIDFAMFHAVNSETGAIQDFDSLARQLRAAHPQVVMLADFIQGAGKMLSPADWDILVVSGHKFGSPGGAALFYRDGALEAKLGALRHRFYRVGRVEAPVIATMAATAERMSNEMEQNRERVAAINGFLREKLTGNVEFTLSSGESTPYILHFAVPGFQAGVLLRMFSERDIMVAAGSACQSETGTPSRVLKAMKWSDAKAFSALRLSFSPENTLEEAEAFVREFRRILDHY